LVAVGAAEEDSEDPIWDEVAAGAVQVPATANAQLKLWHKPMPYYVYADGRIAVVGVPYGVVPRKDGVVELKVAEDLDTTSKTYTVDVRDVIAYAFKDELVNKGNEEANGLTENWLLRKEPRCLTVELRDPAGSVAALDNLVVRATLGG
jgi:hypothetical protein